MLPCHFSSSDLQWNTRRMCIWKRRRTRIWKWRRSLTNESDRHTADDSVRGTHSEKQTKSNKAKFIASNDWDVVCATETSRCHRRLCRGAVFEVIRVRNKTKVIRYYEVIQKKNGARHDYRRENQPRLRTVAGRWCESCDHMFWSSTSCYGHNCQLRWVGQCHRCGNGGGEQTTMRIDACDG